MPRPRFFKLEECKQKEIVRICSEEFVIKGYHQTSFNSLMAKLGISKGAMYYYFDDKTDLYIMLIRNAHEKYSKVLWETTPSRVSSKIFWEGIGETYSRVLNFLKENPIEAGLLGALWDARYNPELVERLGDLFEDYESWSRVNTEAAQKAGYCRRDLPLGLLVSLNMSIAETIGRWNRSLQKQKSDTKGNRVSDITHILLDLSKRILSPA